MGAAAAEGACEAHTGWVHELLSVVIRRPPGQLRAARIQSHASCARIQ